jgi:hypothetical protein
MGLTAGNARPSLPGTGKGDRPEGGGWGCGTLMTTQQERRRLSVNHPAKRPSSPPTMLRMVPPPRSGEGWALYLARRGAHP